MPLPLDDIRDLEVLGASLLDKAVKLGIAWLGVPWLWATRSELYESRQHPSHLEQIIRQVDVYVPSPRSPPESFLPSLGLNIR